MSMNYELLDTLSIGISILDANLHVVWVNRAYEEFFDVCRDEIHGHNQRQFVQRHFGDLFEEKDFAANISKAYAEHREVENFPCHLLPVRGREERWFHFSSRLLTPTVWGRIEYYTDISASKRSEAALRDSEARFQAFMENIPAIAFIKDDAGRYIYLNRAVELLTATPREELMGKTNYDRLPAEIAAQLCENDSIVLQSGAVKEFVEQVPGADGRIHHLLTIKFPMPDGEKSPLLAGVAIDISEHKRADAAREELMRRLVTAQEDERHRIARELHDQMGQDLAVLLLGLKSLPTEEELAPAVVQRLQDFQKITRQLMQQTRRLALDLRPETLDKLGLPEALRCHCEEWTKHSGVPIDLHCNGLKQSRLPRTIEMTLYRIVQEALTNVLRHARAQHVSVLLERRKDEARAIIEDDGQGFEISPRLPAQKMGLGLLGMQERATLVGGKFEVESRPKAGTTIFVRIPLSKRAGLVENSA